MSGPINTSNFSKALWPGINSWYGREYKEFDTQYNQLVESFNSKRAYEEDVGITSFGLANRKPEGSGILYDEESQAFVTRYTHVTWGLGFQITREVVEDDQYSVVAPRRARGLAFSMRQTKEIVVANLYNRAFNSSYAGGNGASMVSTAQANYAGGTQSNRSGTDADFSEAALEAAVIQMQKWTDDRGLKINVMPHKLIVPVDLTFDVERVLKTTGQTGISPGATTGGGLNEINAVGRMGIFPGGVCVNNYLTDQDAWFIRTNMTKDGLKLFTRRPMEFTMDNEFETENAKYKATERYSVGWTDWRAIWGSAGS